MLLGLVIEQVRQRPLAEVLRDGVLSGNGLERLVFQPEEVPTEPMAMPFGQSSSALEAGGGYLPSLAGATAAGAAGAMASDSASLARWWSRFCGGELVSEASLTEMTTSSWIVVLDEAETDNYGLGLLDGREASGTLAVGHGGIHVGYTAWAMCFVEDCSVVVVLTNREGDGGSSRSPMTWLSPRVPSRRNTSEVIWAMSRPARRGGPDAPSGARRDVAGGPTPRSVRG